MTKNTMIMLSLLFSFLSLIYTILIYYGYIRYSQLYLYSTKYYISKYPSLNKIDNNMKIIISLTATKNELKNLKPVINSLLDQTVKVDLISVVLPYKTKYSVPLHLKDAIIVFNTQIDHKDLNAIIPPAQREGESNTKIITLGADKIYGKDFIQKLLETSSKYPKRIIHCNDINIRNGMVFPINSVSQDFLNHSPNINSTKWIKKHFKSCDTIKITYSENYTKL